MARRGLAPLSQMSSVVPAGRARLTRATTVLPLTVRVVVVTVTPEAVVVATEWVTCGPAAAEVPVVPAAVPPATPRRGRDTSGRRLVGLVGQRHGGRPGAGDERGGRPVRHPPGVPDAVPAGHAPARWVHVRFLPRECL